MFCWLHKLMISHAQDGNSGLPGITKKHINRCPDCCRFYKMCQSLGESLTREAALVNDKTFRRLNKQVISAVSARRIGTSNIKIKLWLTAAAACFVLIFLIGALLMVAQRDSRDIVEAKKPQMADAIQELRIIYSRVGRDLHIRPDAIEKPLANEFKSLTDDTQSAVRFLAACVTVDIAGVESAPFN